MVLFSLNSLSRIMFKTESNLTLYRRMRLSLVFGVCIVAGLVGLLTAQCDRNDDIDGCSIPFGLHTPFKLRFTPSCYKHDVCYFCGAALGISKTTCDDKFYNEMNQECKNVSRKDVDRQNLGSLFCKVFSGSYYGMKFFDSSTRMRLSLVFGVCIAAGLVGLVTAQCNRNGDINGCSIPFGLPLPFKQKFTPSCYKHDVCYFCGAARAISRSRCDAKFLTDMENACRGIGNSQDREKCSKWANRYKGAVRLGGFLYYKKKPKNWCSESWVSGCLP
ncbi:hypothetical protein LOTGIDRAFT_159173 [Lottia gigantea]|uniref:Phospholipase A2 domain-containing protein n=1 Tax=Lottia gigantea TaxID=225164 RepID=V4A3G0_LOTGI|nr:hypothetical protein LOTGIDRAFT_159173 [Lottia gigantea]ESO98368.1 hypothetical protein LOTGIDRAFT_159173 [Lottia gigantea]